MCCKTGDRVVFHGALKIASVCVVCTRVCTTCPCVSPAQIELDGIMNRTVPPWWESPQYYPSTSLGFMTTQLPAAMAAAAGARTRLIGKFHAPRMNTTPLGTCLYEQLSMLKTSTKGKKNNKVSKCHITIQSLNKID